MKKETYNVIYFFIFLIPVIMLAVLITRMMGLQEFSETINTIPINVWTVGVIVGIASYILGRKHLKEEVKDALRRICKVQPQETVENKTKTKETETDEKK